MKTRYLRAENDRVCFNQSLKLMEIAVGMQAIFP